MIATSAQVIAFVGCHAIAELVGAHCDFRMANSTGPVHIDMNSVGGVTVYQFVYGFLEILKTEDYDSVDEMLAAYR